VINPLSSSEYLFRAPRRLRRPASMSHPELLKSSPNWGCRRERQRPRRAPCRGCAGLRPQVPPLQPFFLLLHAACGGVREEKRGAGETPATPLGAGRPCEPRRTRFSGSTTIRDGNYSGTLLLTPKRLAALCRYESSRIFEQHVSPLSMLVPESSAHWEGKELPELGGSRPKDD
jgi:hypothetical protein